MRPYIVAEVSANHRGDMRKALDLIYVAKDVGADAVKFQLYDPKKMAPPDMVIESGPWKGRNAQALYLEAATPVDWFPTLFAEARKIGIEPFASVFCPEGLATLEALDCARYKIASFELVDYELIKAVAQTHKPMIISTGMGTYNEIRAAAFEAWESGCSDITLLKCTSAYPAKLSDMHLTTITDMISKAGPARIGLSDHSHGPTAAIVATALGATMIEKHLILNRDDGGPDAAFSAEPFEFKDMVVSVTRAAEALGTVRYGPTQAEMPHVQLRGRTIQARNG